MDAGEKDAKKAAIKAMSEIAPAIVSITLVMSAVFIPVSFLGGTSGVFFKQFGLTLAMAILISALNALTLSPALCALLLKPHEDSDLATKSLPKKFVYFFNIGFSAATEKYKHSLYFLSTKKHRWITVAIVAVFALLFFGLIKMLPTGFVPQEDSGTVMGSVVLSPGSSFERTDSVTKSVVKIAEAIPDVKSVTSLTGFSFMGGSGSSYGGILIKMKPWKERKMTTNDVATLLKQKTTSVTDATFMFFGVPTLQGFGLSNGVSLEMQDKTGGDINQFFNVVTEFLNKLQKRPEIMTAMKKVIKLRPLPSYGNTGIIIHRSDKQRQAGIHLCPEMILSVHAVKPIIALRPRRIGIITSRNRQIDFGRSYVIEKIGNPLTGTNQSYHPIAFERVGFERIIETKFIFRSRG